MALGEDESDDSREMRGEEKDILPRIARVVADEMETSDDMEDDADFPTPRSIGG